MLRKYDAVVTLAVHNMQEAREFYTKLLGPVEEKMDAEGLSVLSSGKTRLNLSPSRAAGVNNGTVCTWWVGGEFDNVVSNLKSRGLTYEHYEGPGMELKDDIHTLTDINRRVVWFKDPSDNILSIVDQ